MNKAVIRKSERIYDFLLNFYPKNYRQEFGEEMKYVFSQSLKDAYTENGDQGILILWVRTVVDAGKSLLMQHIENQTRPLTPERSDGERGGGDAMKTKSNDIIMQNKVFLWIALATSVILSIPLLTNAPWTMSDFVIAGIVLFVFGSIFVLAARKFRKHRLIVGLIVAFLFLWLWVELAVGLFTNWGS